MYLHSLTGLGDLDADGILDYAYTSHDHVAGIAHMVVRSGADHRFLWTAWDYFGREFGQTIAGNLDLNGDGSNDVLTSRAGSNLMGEVIAYDAVGAVIYTLPNTDPNVLIGVELARLGGDLDGDGGDDFVMACADVTGRGQVRVISGRTGAVLQTGYGEQQGDSLSNCVGCGDVDGDGVLDFAGGGEWGFDIVRIFSGASGQPIHTYRQAVSTTPCGFAIGSCLGSADFDQDGINDIWTTAIGCHAIALSGRTGEVLFHFSDSRWPFGGSSAGYAAAVTRPPVGERYPIVLYTEPSYVNPNRPGFTNVVPGLVWAHRTSPPTVTTFGQPTSSIAQHSRMGMRKLSATQARFTLSGAPAGALGLLAFGLSSHSIGGVPLPLSLAPLGLPGITLLTSTNATRFAPTGTNGIAGGYAQVDLAVTFAAAAGVPLLAQWLWLDPLDVTRHGSTDAHRFVLQ